MSVSPSVQGVSTPISPASGFILTKCTTPGDVAISSASFVLVRSDLQSIVTLIDLSRTVFRRVKLNFVSILSFFLSVRDLDN